jgi:hypothetical protein
MQGIQWRTTLHSGFLATHFVRVKWYLLINQVPREQPLPRELMGNRGKFMGKCGELMGNFGELMENVGN